MSKPAASARELFCRIGCLLAVAALSGCDLLTVSQTGRNIREGNEAMVRGEVQKAQQNYEAALDGTMLSAEAHYRLGLLYEDKLKNEVAALHHFERYLELAPQGQFATDVKGYVDRLRLMIVSRLSEGPVVPAREATRLKNENLALKEQLAELRQQAPAARTSPAALRPAPPPIPAATPGMVVAATPPPAPAVAVPAAPEVRRALPVNATAAAPVNEGDTPRVTPIIPAGAVSAAPAAAAGGAPVRTYQVKSGDTLAAIARQFYKNSGQWPKILEANKATLEDPKRLKPGMVLVIP